MDSPPEGTKKRRALSVPTNLFKSSKNIDNKKSGTQSPNPTLTSLYKPTSNIEAGCNPHLSTRQAQQARANMMPYRENGVLKYMPGPAVPQQAGSRQDQSSLASGSSSEINVPHDKLFSFNSYESDCEPLMAERDSDVSHLDNDAVMRFTATGRPMPTYKPSALANMSGSWFINPQHLPQRYTDESIIPVIVKMNQENTQGAASPPTSRRKSFMGKLKGSEKLDAIKVVYMPRGEYLKYFARDQNANYIGTEPEQVWTEQELDDKYAKYKKL